MIWNFLDRILKIVAQLSWSSDPHGFLGRSAKKPCLSTRGGGGIKNVQKSVHMVYEWPLMGIQFGLRSIFFYKESFLLLGLCLGKHLTLAYFLKIRTLFFHIFIYLANLNFLPCHCSVHFSMTHTGQKVQKISHWLYLLLKISAIQEYNFIQKHIWSALCEVV